MKKIADFYLTKILTSSKYNSSDPVSDMSLLFPDFLTKVKKCIADYRNTYPDQDITFTETYRSNILQEEYYNSGASKIKKDGMHHFGIAGDSIFIIKGKRSYKGDINLLRKIYKENGLSILGMWDPLHVQYIPVNEQQKLRKEINAALKEKKIVPPFHAAGENASVALLEIQVTNAEPGNTQIQIAKNGITQGDDVTGSDTVTIPDVNPGDIIEVDCRSLGNVSVTLTGVNADIQTMRFNPPGGSNAFNIRN